MQSTIIQIGNSKGVRLPKDVLILSGIKKDIDIKVKRGEIKIVPIAESAKRTLNEEYVLSLSGLSDWDTPEEDKAWAYLQ